MTSQQEATNPGLLAAFQEFVTGPLGKEAAEKAAAKLLAERKALRAAMDADQVAAERAIPAADAAVRTEVAAEASSFAAYQSARARTQAARRARSALGVALDGAQGPRRARLIETADPAIAAAIARWRDLAERGRRELRPSTEFEGVNAYGVLVNPLRSTGPAIVAYLDGLKAACEAGELLKLEPLNRDEMLKRLAAMVRALPDPNAMVALE
jgi:hypothetical protein